MSGAFKTGKYRNVFAELGISEEDIEKRAYFHINTTTFRLDSFQQIIALFSIPPPTLTIPTPPQYNYLW